MPIFGKAKNSELKKKRAAEKAIWERETGNAVTKEKHDARFDAEMAKKKDREEREEEQKRKEAREREEHLQSLKEADLQTDPRKNGTLGERHQALEKDAMWDQPENPMETLKRHNQPLTDRLQKARQDEKSWRKRGDGMRTEPVRDHPVNRGSVDMGSIEERKNGAISHGQGYFEVEIKKTVAIEAEPLKEAKKQGVGSRLENVKASQDEWTFRGDGMRTKPVRDISQHAGENPKPKDAKTKVAESMIEVKKAIDADVEGMAASQEVSVAARFDLGRDKHDQWKENGDGMRGLKANEDGGREHTVEGFEGNKARLDAVYASQNDWKEKGDGMRGVKVNDDGGRQHTEADAGSREARKLALLQADSVQTERGVDHWKSQHGMRPKMGTLTRPPKEDSTCRWHV